MLLLALLSVLIDSGSGQESLKSHNRIYQAVFRKCVRVLKINCSTALKETFVLHPLTKVFVFGHPVFTEKPLVLVDLH